MRITRPIEDQAASAVAASAVRRPSKGFTMIELMMVVAILAILSALAAPSMSSMIATQRLRSVATDLHLALVKARAEAIKRNDFVTVTPTDGSWTAGWSILPAGGGAALDVRGPTASVTVTTTATQVVYRPNGRTQTTTGPFVISASSTDATKCLSINSSGRPYVKEGSTC